MKRAKRFLSVLLTLCMVLGMLPGTVFAANSSIPFTDVKKTDWFYEAVQYVYENGMMSGTGDTTFSPDTTTTRGMIVTILHRMEGKPSAAGEKFVDVAAGQYYADAVAWASANGIVSGYGNNLFGPNDPITREQMAAILYRYVQHKGYDDAVKGDVSAFADGNQVSSYAVKAMNWAVGVGLISGVGNNMLDPAGSATRAQVATILMRFCENIVSPGQPEATYTVDFDYNYSDKGIYQSVTVKAGNTVDKPSNPKRSGYSFKGWYTKSAGGSKFDFDTEITKDITLYAQWSKKNSGGSGGGSDIPPVKSYTVTFESNGGSTVASQTVAEGQTAAQPADPTRDGYRFLGWYSDSALTTVYDFETAVTSDITLYAGWTSKSKMYLYTTCNAVLVGSSDSVYAYLETELNVESIALFNAADLTTPVATMYDDGLFDVHGDDMAGDGVYSACLTNLASADAIFNLVAVYEENKSNAVGLNFYTAFTSEEIAKMENVDNTIAKILADGFFEKTMEEKKNIIETALQEHVKAGEIKDGSIFFDEDNALCSFQYETGALGGILLEDIHADGSEFNGTGTTGDGISIEVKNSDGEPVNASVEEYPLGKALILNSFPSFETDPEDIAYRTTFYNTTRSDWNSKGLETTVDTSVTVSDYYGLDEYDVVCISTHGSTYSWNDGFLWLNHHTVPAICLSEAVSGSKDEEYSVELKNKEIAKVDGEYWILPAFIQNEYGGGDLSDTFVFSECCQAMGKGQGSATDSYNYEMANAFTNSGAEAYIGFHNSVFATYSRKFMKHYVDQLIEGKTSIQAYNSAVATYGSNHEIWYNNEHSHSLKDYYEIYKDNPETYVPDLHIAYPVHNGNDNAVLVNTDLKNGDFESVNIFTKTPRYWNREGDVRTLKQLGDVKPVSGKGRMAVITTGIGAQSTNQIGNGTEGSIMSQTFIVPTDAKELAFEYNFISEEPMEYVGSKYDDAFAVLIDCEGSQVHNNIYESINSSTWVSVGGIDFSGGDKTVYQTNWKTAKIDVSAYAGKVITLKFVIYDVGDSIYDSACVIDNVKLSK